MNGREKLSGSKWFTRHIQQLLADGIQYISAGAVYEAGFAAGYSKSDVGNAAHNQPIRIAAVKNGITWWCIDPNETVTYKPVREFIGDYLDALGRDVAEVDPTHFYGAADAAGIDRHTARKVLVRDSGRVESVPAHGQSKVDRIWLLKREEAS
ncbi:hypothetical protein [Mycolicibacterium sphagni]|uniref:Uncharacterized protein n=1 Tax=Mycolicibacterium sphagni TaxID=1786 RepID=A0A255DNT9_9MYCO|nr:hypothetical protein [Mycolicibacterium sphagni]OYN78895.1 hypothetical protein CG716_13585 [Mycolicibacterium sphagni]